MSYPFKVPARLCTDVGLALRFQQTSVVLDRGNPLSRTLRSLLDL